MAGDMEGASEDYGVGIDLVGPHSGHSCAYLRSTSDEPMGFIVLSQRFSASDFAGKRIKLTGYIRAESVVNWAGLWRRINDSDGALQSFDNMENRPVRGTCEWVRREIVLDAPANAFAIGIGALLVGCGQIWIDDLSIESAPNDLLTAVPEFDLPLSPTNLDFEIY